MSAATRIWPTLRPWLRAAAGMLGLWFGVLFVHSCDSYSLAGPTRVVAEAPAHDAGTLRIYYRPARSKGHTWLTLTPPSQEERAVCWWPTEYIAPKQLEVRHDSVVLRQTGCPDLEFRLDLLRSLWREGQALITDNHREPAPRRGFAPMPPPGTCLEFAEAALVCCLLWWFLKRE